MSSQFPGVQPTPQPTGPRGGSSTTKIVLIIVGIIGGLGLLGCGCCGGMWYWGLSTLGNGVKQQYANHPVVNDRIGQIEKISMNVTGTGERSQRGEKDTLVFDVKGTKGSGQLVVRDQQGTSFGSATLIVDGKEYPLN